MPRVHVSSLLRFGLRLDAMASMATGAASLAWAAHVAMWVGTSPSQVHGVGAFMLAYGFVVGVLSARPTLPVWCVWFVVIGNALWTIDSLLLVLADWIEPGALGTGLILVQAAAVAVFAGLQFVGLRRSAAAP